eukprot:UN24621
MYKQKFIFIQTRILNPNFPRSVETLADHFQHLHLRVCGSCSQFSEYIPVGQYHHHHIHYTMFNKLYLVQL